MSGRPVGGYLEAGAVVADRRMAALVWDAFGPSMVATLPILTEAVRAEVRPFLLALRTAAVSDSGSAERQITDPVVPSVHEISAAEAAAMIGVSARRVGQMCDAGALVGRVVAGRRLVTEESVAEEIDRRSRGAA